MPINGHAAPTIDMSDRDDEHERQMEARYNAKKEWSWAVAQAKASGQPPPPKPPLLLSPLPPLATSTTRTNGTADQSYKRKSAMGADRHKEAVRSKSKAQINELRSIESRYEVARAQGYKGTLESFEDRERYRQRVQRAQQASEAADAFAPSRPFLQHRASSSSIASPSSSSALSRGPASSNHQAKLEQLIREAKQLSKDQSGIARRPDSFKFPKFDELQQQVDELVKQTREHYDEVPVDLQKRRRRKWPKRLSPEDEAVVNAALKDASFVSKVEGGEVASKDLRRLKGLTWLNDEIVTFYAIMINLRSKRIHSDDAASSTKLRRQFKRAYSFNSFFYNKLRQSGYAGVKRWTKRVDLFAQDIVIVPINVSNSHWVCAAINIRDRRFEYYDSLGGANKSVYKRLREYIVAEHLDKKKKPLSLDGWTDYWDDDVPQQENSSDCGVFTCQFMDSLSREGEGFDFDQENIPYLRKRMVLDIKEAAIREEQYA